MGYRLAAEMAASKVQTRAGYWDSHSVEHSDWTTDARMAAM